MGIDWPKLAAMGRMGANYEWMWGGMAAFGGAGLLVLVALPSQSPASIASGAGFAASVPLLTLFAFLDHTNPTILGGEYHRWPWVMYVENTGTTLAYIGWLVGVIALAFVLHLLVGIALVVGIGLSIMIAIGIWTDRVPRTQP